MENDETTAAEHAPDSVRIVQDDAGNKYVTYGEFERVRGALSDTQERVSQLEQSHTQAVTITKPEPDPEIEEPAAGDEYEDDQGADEDRGDGDDETKTLGASDGSGLSPRGTEEPKRFISGF